MENIGGNEYRVRITSDSLPPGTHTLLIEYFYGFDVHGNTVSIPFSGADTLTVNVIMDVNPY